MTAIVGKDAGGQVLTSFSYAYRDAQATDRALRQSATAAVSGRRPHTVTTRSSGSPGLVQRGTTTVKDYRYSYDPAGNRTREQELVGGVEVSASYNAASQLVSRAGVGNTHDANGSMTVNSEGRRFGYNALDQTTSIEAPRVPGPERWSFAGDGQFERVKAKTPNDGDLEYRTSLLGPLGFSGTNGYEADVVAPAD